MSALNQNNTKFDQIWRYWNEQELLAIQLEATVIRTLYLAWISVKRWDSFAAPKITAVCFTADDGGIDGNGAGLPLFVLSFSSELDARPVRRLCRPQHRNMHTGSVCGEITTSYINTPTSHQNTEHKLNSNSKESPGQEGLSTRFHIVKESTWLSKLQRSVTTISRA
ncbi:hypothetical protein RRG08_029227 [Elysia crispata]|uniref:Uncharacterized protein n=1 Tax=Elysia crispata TaxID=231223 RepID=A0AAE1AIX7_9GAST|nr:hypothetical protein RRG08_029227 [Elysia crispata]